MSLRTIREIPSSSSKHFVKAILYSVKGSGGYLGQNNIYSPTETILFPNFFVSLKCYKAGRSAPESLGRNDLSQTTPQYQEDAAAAEVALAAISLLFISDLSNITRLLAFSFYCYNKLICNIFPSLLLFSDNTRLHLFSQAPVRFFPGIYLICLQILGPNKAILCVCAL